LKYFSVSESLPSYYFLLPYFLKKTKTNSEEAKLTNFPGLPPE